MMFGDDVSMPTPRHSGLPACGRQAGIQGYKIHPACLWRAGAPVKGATIEQSPQVFQRLGFNPRSCEGSDAPKLINCDVAECFNPRSREGSDIDESPAITIADMFQSTLP